MNNVETIALKPEQLNKNIAGTRTLQSVYLSYKPQLNNANVLSGIDSSVSPAPELSGNLNTQNSFSPVDPSVTTDVFNLSQPNSEVVVPQSFNTSETIFDVQSPAELIKTPVDNLGNSLGSTQMDVPPIISAPSVTSSNLSNEIVSNNQAVSGANNNLSKEDIVKIITDMNEKEHQQIDEDARIRHARADERKDELLNNLKNITNEVDNVQNNVTNLYGGAQLFDNDQTISVPRNEWNNALEEVGGFKITA